MSTETQQLVDSRALEKQIIRESRKAHIEKLKTVSLPTDTKIGVVLLHGLTGMPNEMRSVELALQNIGCQVEVPMLAGHGASHNELLDTGWKDWVDTGRKAVEKLSAVCDQVYVGGLSMGGLMPMILASENPKICGIIAMSPTIQYDSKNSANPFKVLLPLVDVLPFLGRICYWTEEPPYGLRDERLVRMITKELEAAKIHTGGGADAKSGFSQFRTYAGSLRQLQHLVARVKKDTPKVRCPVLIMHSIEDTLTSVKNPQILHSWLTDCADKEIKYIEYSDHVLPADLKKEEVAYNCAAFICRVAAQNAAVSMRSRELR